MTVTKRGRTVAVVNPPPASAPPRRVFEDMRGTVVRPPLEDGAEAWSLDEEFAESMGMTLEEYRRCP